MKDFVFNEFKSQIEKNGMKIDSVDETGFIFVSKGNMKLKISLENVRRNYERDKDESHISDLVQSLNSYSIELPSKWEEAKDEIFISLYPNEYDFNENVHFKITEEFSKVFVYSGNEKLTWITKVDLENWKISETELDCQANLNANNLLKTATIKFDAIQNHKLGMIEIERTALKGALLFASEMKNKVKADIGIPYYAVIPARDFCYIFSENDLDFFSKKIGKVVVNEYKNSGYPITTEIIKFTDKGVEAVGKFPLE